MSWKQSEEEDAVKEKAEEERKLSMLMALKNTGIVDTTLLSVEEHFEMGDLLGEGRFSQVIGAKRRPPRPGSAAQPV